MSLRFGAPALFLMAALGSFGCGDDTVPPINLPGGGSGDGGGGVGGDGGLPGLGGDGGGGLVGGGGGVGGGVGGSTGGGGLDAGCGGSRADAPLVKSPVDVIWTLDQSLSMVDEALQVTANINQFANNVDMSGANIRMVMVTTLDPAAGSALAGDPMRYRSVLSPVQSTNAFREILNTANAYKDFLRPNAPTHIIVITDDRSDMPSEEFRTKMEAVLGHPFIFHAIANIPSQPCLGAFGSGEAYATLAQQTGGEQIRICEPDWSAVFKRLESAVVASAPLPCEFPIPTPPNGETLDKEAVKVVYTPTGGTDLEFPRAITEDKCGTNTAWYYDTGNTKVLLCPKACDTVRGGGSIDVAFGCEPQILR